MSDHVVYSFGKGWSSHPSIATTSEMPVEINPGGWRVFLANSISFVVETLQLRRAHRSAVGSGAAEDLQKLTTIWLRILSIKRWRVQGLAFIISYSDGISK